MANFLGENHYPAYIFDPRFNPSRQPRVGIGYMVIGLISILAKLKTIPVADEEAEKMISFLTAQNTLFTKEKTLSVNPAKQLADKLEGKIPIFITADFLTEAAYAVRNMINETAKQFAVYFYIPELNHHLLEGLSYPKDLAKLLQFIFIDSPIYDERNKKRLTLTQKIVEKNNFACQIINLSSSSALSQTMEFLQLGSWLSFYLAMLNDADPSEIPWVDYFKENLKT